jgi:hypothetical protein
MSVEIETVEARLDGRLRAALKEVENDPRTQAALDELRGLIRAAYPTATFDIKWGREPIGIYLTATLDIEELDDADGLVTSRLMEMQVEEGLPVYVDLEQPRERVLTERRRRQEAETGAVREPVAAG